MPNLTLGNVRAFGAIIDVAVGLIAPREKALERAGLPSAMPILLKALIDSGAAMTLVDVSVVAELGLLPTGETGITTPSTGLQTFLAPTYEVKLQLIGPPHVSISPAMTVIAVDLSGLDLGFFLVATSWRVVCSTTMGLLISSRFRFELLGGVPLKLAPPPRPRPPP